MDCANLSFGWAYRLGGRHPSEKGAGRAFLREVSFTHWARLRYVELMDFDIKNSLQELNSFGPKLKGCTLSRM